MTMHATTMAPHDGGLTTITNGTDVQDVMHETHDTHDTRDQPRAARVVGRGGACATRLGALCGAAILGVAVTLPPAEQAARADDDAPRASNDDVMRRLDRISAGLERLLDRMGPPDRSRGLMERPEGERRDGDPERRPEPGRPDGPPRGGPRPPWNPPGTPPMPEMPPPPGLPHEMRERMERMMREGRERMQDGVRRMEEAREKFEAMERRIQRLEDEVRRLKKAQGEP